MKHQARSKLSDKLKLSMTTTGSMMITGVRLTLMLKQA
jgi:hypothetical protein